MIKKLQKKFISITAAALFTMILLVLAAVNGTFFFQSNRQLDVRLDMIMSEYLNTPPDSPLPGMQKLGCISKTAMTAVWWDGWTGV